MNRRKGEQKLAGKRRRVVASTVSQLRSQYDPNNSVRAAGSNVERAAWQAVRRSMDVLPDLSGYATKRVSREPPFTDAGGVELWAR